MTDSAAHPKRYEQALELAEAGRHGEALEAIREHLLAHPNDGEALNDAGALLYAMGRFAESAEHLKKALKHLRQVPAQTLWNLAEVYLADGRPAEAMGLFDDLAAAEILTADLANRTANAFLADNDRASAIEALLRSKRVSPDQQVLDPIAEQVRRLRPKVGFFCSPRPNAMLEAVRGFAGERFRTRIYRGRSKEELAAFLHECDIACFEHCGQEAILVSRLPKTCRTIVHVAPHEAYRPWIEQVDWLRTDVLLTSGSRTVRDLLARRIGSAAAALAIEHLPHGVDVDRLPFTDRPRGKNLACLGNLSLHKNPMGLLQCFARLHQADPAYGLFFAGTFQDDLLEPYVLNLIDELGLSEAVHFDGWQEDVPAWLADKQYIVSAGIIEGHGTGLMEAMAMGLKPVVHVFPGARDLLADEHLYRTAEEFCRRIVDEPYEPRAYRQFAAEHFSLDCSLRTFNDVLVRLERQPAPVRKVDRGPGAAPADAPAEAGDGEASEFLHRTL